jgi:hypothetical protein
MTSDVVDRWLRMRYPEQFGDYARRTVNTAVRNALERTGIPEEARRTGQDKWDLLDQRATERFADAIRAQDAGGLLSVLDMSAEELVALSRQKGRRSAGGKARAPHIERALECALAAFLEVDQEHGTHAEAMKRALKATEPLPFPPSEKTIREWLSRIAGRPWSNIAAPQRGRPKKPT